MTVASKQSGASKNKPPAQKPLPKLLFPLTIGLMNYKEISDLIEKTRKKVTNAAARTAGSRMTLRAGAALVKGTAEKANWAAGLY